MLAADAMPASPMVIAIVTAAINKSFSFPIFLFLLLVRQRTVSNISTSIYKSIPI
jgi:hypothetical protein